MGLGSKFQGLGLGVSNAKGFEGFLRKGYTGFDILVMEGYVGLRFRGTRTPYYLRKDLCRPCLRLYLAS